MAIRSSDQISIVDVTDAYSVILTSESYTFIGSTNAAIAGSCTTQAVAFRGDEQVACSVVANECTTPTGITVSVDTNTISPTITISASTSFTNAGQVTIPVHIGEVTINKKFSVSIAFKGAGGTAARSVILGNEAVTVMCDKNGNVASTTTITVPFAGYSGTARAACTASASIPSGSDVTLKTNTAATASADGSLVFEIPSGADLGGANSVEITITLTNSSAFTKKLTITKSITGATGQQGPQGIQGIAGVSATSVVCGNESVSLPCTLGGLVKAATTITIPFAGYIGTSRAACTVTYSTLPSGVTLKTNGNTPSSTSADGSLIFSVAANANLGGASVMSGEITLTFTCNSQTFVKKFSWAKAMTGATGDKGEDAITISITSSNGLIFKNTSIATTLTAHVYQAGAEVTGSNLTALGTIKWYKDGGETAVAAGQTLTITAGEVDNKATYVAQLES